MADYDEAMKGQSFHQPSQPEVTSQNLAFLSEQQVEEKRLCSDIHRYLVNKSSGVFHYSVELRTIIVDIIGISYKSSEEEIRETETRLLDLLYSDPQRRFSIIGEYDQIFVKLAPLDEDQINKLVEEWRCLIASFLFESKRIVCLSDIGSSVRRPNSIPSSVKLIYIIKSDPLNRFVLQGEGNVAKVRFNMQTDPDQESLWVAKWRDDIAAFLTKQQWSSPSIGIEGIESHIVRPFFLHPGVQLLDVLAVDPFQRFVIMGFGADARVTIRTFRGDEPEIEKYVEQWRKLITEYLLSKNDVLGASHLPIGLSKIGAYVARPIGVPASVKLIDVMRTDPLNRFTVNGDGNALRVTINAESQLAGITPNDVLEGDDEKKLSSHTIQSNRLASFSNGQVLANVRPYQQESGMSFGGASNTRSQMTSSPGLTSHGAGTKENADYLGVSTGGGSRLPLQPPHSPSANLFNRRSFRDQAYPSPTYQEYHSTLMDRTSVQHVFDEQRIRQEQLLQVQQFHQRNFPTLPPNDQIQQHFGEFNKSSILASHSASSEVIGTGAMYSGHNTTMRLNLPERDRHNLSHDLSLPPGRRGSSNTDYDYSSGSVRDVSEYDCIAHSDYDDLPWSQSDTAEHRSPLLSYAHDGIHRNSSLRRPSSADDIYSGHPEDSCKSDRSASLLSNANCPSQALSLGFGFGSLFHDGFGNPSDAPQPLPTHTFHSNSSCAKLADEEISSMSFIPPHKWMIKAWLPIAFEGFDLDVIEYFVVKLRDDGGFVTLQDLLDARSSNELTREALADIAGFKLGHFNRLEKALSIVDKEAHGRS